MSSNPVTVVEQDVFRGHPIRRLHIASAKLTDAVPLTHIKSTLEDLDLRINRIEYIPYDYFHGCRILRNVFQHKSNLLLTWFGLHRWHSIFSGFLGKQFEKSWCSTTRHFSDAEVFVYWIQFHILSWYKIYIKNALPDILKYRPMQYLPASKLSQLSCQ